LAGAGAALRATLPWERGRVWRVIGHPILQASMKRQAQ
jgi:hypothetical protein